MVLEFLGTGFAIWETREGNRTWLAIGESGSTFHGFKSEWGNEGQELVT